MNDLWRGIVQIKLINFFETISFPCLFPSFKKKFDPQMPPRGLGGFARRCFGTPNSKVRSAIPFDLLCPQRDRPIPPPSTANSNFSETIGPVRPTVPVSQVLIDAVDAVLFARLLQNLFRRGRQRRPFGCFPAPHFGSSNGRSVGGCPRSNTIRWQLFLKFWANFSE